MKDWICHIGDIHSIEGKGKICVFNFAEGWPAKAALAGGGAMADIGWHLLDMMIRSSAQPWISYSYFFTYEMFKEMTVRIVLKLY